MRFIKAMATMFAVGVVGLLVGASPTVATGDPASDEADDYQVTIPIAVRGPFVWRPEVIALLDCAKECGRPLAFAHLIQARLPNADAEDGNGGSVASDVLKTVATDLKRLRSEAMVGKEQLDPRFLVDEGSHVELVGVVNRMDRQFIKDPALRYTKAQRDCGEISLIYRFAYSIPNPNGAQASRLPVTMNLVLPALPSRTKGGKITCQMIADRWRTEGSKDPGRTPQKIVEDLTNADSGPLAFIDGRDIERLELNMQAYRISAGSDSTDFGTKAAYLIRVFRWNGDQKRFTVSYLGNQIGAACSATAAQTPTARRISDAAAPWWPTSSGGR